MKTTSILGFYDHGTIISADDFFKANFPVLRKYFDLASEDVDLICANAGSDHPSVMVGTPAKPLSINGQIKDRPPKMQVVCNLQSMIPTLVETAKIGGGDLIPIAAMLWNYTAYAFRMFYVMSGNVACDDLIKGNVYKYYGFERLRQSHLKEFLSGDMNGSQMELEVDVMFIGAYISELVVEWGARGAGFHFDEFVRIIKVTTMRNMVPRLS